MKKIVALLTHAFGLSLLTLADAHADDYIRTFAGDFASADWFNATTNQGPHVGPPGAGDNASLGGLAVSSTGASVLSVGNGRLTLTGRFNAPTISGGLTLSGPEKLFSQTGSAIVDGGHLVVQNYTASPIIVISNGGTIEAGTIPDLAQGSVLGGGSLAVASAVSNINLTLGGGSSFRAPAVTNGRSITVTVNDAGSLFNVDGTFVVRAGFVDVDKGALKVANRLRLEGGSDQSGGGGHWKGSGATISAPEIFVGNANDRFSLAVDSGATVASGSTIIASEAGSLASVTIADPTTTWEVQSGRMMLGQGGRGTFAMTSGARLAFGGRTELHVGFATGSNGSLTSDNATLDARGALVGIGRLAGSQGSMRFTNAARALFDDQVTIGESGSGSLTLASGSSATSSGNFFFLVGDKPGGTGNVSVSGSVLTVAGPTTVAVDGVGSLGLGTDGMAVFTHSAGMVVGLNAGSNGTVTLGSGGKLSLAGQLVLGDSGTAALDLNSTAQLNLAAGSDVNLVLGGAKGGSGSLKVNNAGTLVDSAPILIGRSGSGTVTATQKSTVQVFGFSAPFAAGGQATITVDDSNWVNSYNIYLGSLPASAPPSTLLVRNNATMRVGQRMTVFPSGTATISTGGRIAVGSGDFGPAGSVRVSTGGMLSGHGRVQGQVIVAQGGAIFPGNSTGILGIDGSYQQEAGSTTSIEIGGPEAGAGYDQINVTGAATLGGNLRVRLVNGFAPTVGQTFRFVNAASVSGTYASVSSPSQAGVVLDSDASGVTLRIVDINAAAPVISSKTTATVAPGAPFGYLIAATNNPSSFFAADLPAGLTLNAASGLISGTVSAPGTYLVSIGAINAAGAGIADFLIQVDPVFKISPLDGGSTVVEYLNTADFAGSPGGHYFYSSDSAEQAIVDSGAAGRFARTGRQFLTGGSAPVCRFYGSLTPGPNSHFFTVDVDECNGLKAAQVTPPPIAIQQWNYEGISYSTTPAVVGANGVRSCPAGTLPLYRAYNNAFPPVGPRNPWDSNHRFTPALSDIASMVALGWRDEGIVFCTAQ